MNKSHPLQKQFGKNPDAIFQHAEINCLVNFLRTYDENILRKATLYVGRVYGKSMENIGLAMPCMGCSKAIKHFGIKRVVHT